MDTHEPPTPSPAAPRARRSVDRPRIEAPRPADGLAVAELVRRSGGLDANSPYAYVMLCDVFRATTRVARDPAGSVVGFVSGFLRPDAPDRLFLWQIGVDASLRGRGVGAALLDAFVRSEGAAGARYLETTITPDNASSLALFGRFAVERGASLDRIGRYEAAWLGDHHAPEDLYEVRLGRLEPIR